MIYSQIYLKNKTKIPSLLVFVVILALVLALIKILTKTTIPYRASSSSVKRVQESNLLPTQVTVFWQTTTKESGCVFLYNQYKQLVKSGKFIFFDERDL